MARRLVRGVALRLLVATSRYSEVALVARRVGCVRALVVLDIARAREGVAEVLERGVAIDLELAVRGRGDGGGGDTTERAGERLEVLARRGSGSGGRSSSGGGRLGGSCGGRSSGCGGCASSSRSGAA